MFLLSTIWPLLLLDPTFAMPSGSKREVQVLETDSSLVLALHNKYRVEHGSPPLTWDNALASYALDWSQHCVFQHSAVITHP